MKSLPFATVVISALTGASLATVTPVIEFHLGEPGSLNGNNAPLDSATGGSPAGSQDIINPISGTTGVAIGSAGVFAPGSTAYLDTSAATNSGWYAAASTGLPTDNFAVGVFARAASLDVANRGDVFCLAGGNGAYKLSLGANGWAASSHNLSWIGPASGVTGSFSPRTWAHLALVRQSGVTTFYINGVAQGTYGGAPAQGSMHLSVDPGGSNYFDGMIDEARVVTFDAADATVDILNALTAGPVPVPDRLVQTATTAYDQVSLGASTTSHYRPGIDTTTINKVDSFAAAVGHTLAIIPDSNLTIGSYELLRYNAATPVNPANISLQLPSRMAATLVQNSDSAPLHVLSLEITSLGTVNWNGNVSSVWDTGTAPDVGGVANWISNSASTNFVAGDSVIFDESATSYTVAINGADVNPGAVLIDPLGVDYVFTGTHGISGSCALTKSSSGKVIIANNNSYTGGTVLLQGTLELGNGGTTGSLGAGEIVNQATLVFHRSDALTINNVMSGAGTLMQDGSGSTIFPGAVASTGGVVVSEGSMIFQNATTNSAFTIAADAQLEIFVADATNRNMATSTVTGAGRLIKSGNGALVWPASAATFALDSGSLIDVQGGVFVAGSSANENWTANKSDLHVAAGAVFDGSEATTVALGGIFLDALSGDGVIRVGYGSPGSYASKITFGVDNGSGTFAGVLANDEAMGSYVKVGTGTQILTGANTYTGDTNVEAGTLSLAQAYLADGADVRLLAGATLELTHTAVDTIDQLFVDGVAQPAGIYGSLASAAPTKVAYLTGTGMLRVGLFGYPAWAQANAGSLGAAADSDGDGVPNGVEYFMGQLSAERTPNPSVVNGKVTWPRDPAALANFQVQVSDNLETWTSAPTANVDSSDPTKVVYTLPTGEAKHFVRLLVAPL